jgi:hypothetical protein
MSVISKACLGLPLLALAVLPFPSRVHGQSTAPTLPEHVISGSPLSLLAGWFNAEYERRLDHRTTVGITGGWLELDEDDYTGVCGFLRYYLRESAFSGFYVGGRAGFFRVDDGEKESSPIGLGLDVGYGWLLGPGGSIYVGLGIGATRLIGGDLDEASATIPSVRLLNLGIAF